MPSTSAQSPRGRDGGRGLVRLAGIGEGRYRAERGREDVCLADGEGAARGAGGISDARDGDRGLADFDIVAIGHGVVDALYELGTAHGHEGLGLDFMAGIGILAGNRHGGFRNVEGHDRVGLADGEPSTGLPSMSLNVAVTVAEPGFWPTSETVCVSGSTVISMVSELSMLHSHCSVEP